MEDPQDFLSLSVSLVNILCHVAKKDILNCKMVNRRINEVIERNNVYFPRINAHLFIYLENFWKDSNAVKVEVVVEEGIDKKEWNCYLRERKSIDIHKDNENHPISRLLANCEIQTEEETLQNRQYGNLLCELETVLKIIFRRYNLAEIRINNRGTEPNVQEDYCALICGLFKSLPSNSKRLYIDRIAWPFAKKLQNHLEISTLGLCYMDDIQLLPSILTRQHISIYILTAVSVDVKLILINAVLKAWERGDCRFKYIGLFSRAEYQPIEPEVFGYLKSERWFDMKCIEVDDTSCELQFRREMDDRLLRLLVKLAKGRPIASEYFSFTDECHTTIAM